MTDRSIYICAVIRKKMTKAEKTRQFIIEKSAPIFNTKGLAATAMSDVMEATKLAKGSLYVHFENKEELCYAVVDHNLGILGDKVMGSVKKHKTAKQKLFAYLDCLSTPMQPPVEGGCPIINFGMEADDTNPIIKKKINAIINLTEENIAAIVNQGIEDGEFRKGWNAKEFGIKMFAMVEGGIMVSRMAGSNAKMKVIIKQIKQEIEEQE